MLVLLILLATGGLTAQAQLQVTCPGNITVNSGTSGCNVVVNYPPPTSNATSFIRDTFFFTGSVQTFTVPPSVDSILIECFGAQGGSSNDRSPTNGAGGLGGFTSGKLPVTNGQVLNIYVGGEGDVNGTGGFNGGGQGGTGSAGSSCFGGPAGGGGGASDVRAVGTTLADRVIVAGGGGASGRDYCNGTCQPCGCGGGGGGAGGGVGGPGQAAYNCGFNYPGQNINFGGGGTATAGGTAGPQDNGSTNLGTAGGLGIGGTGSNGQYDVAGGGGGGGYYGGGGGGGAANGSGVGGGGGGGGSGYVDASMLPVGSTAGVQTGDGMVILEYGAPSSFSQTAGLASGALFPVGVTTNTFQAIQGTDTATCSFTVTVVDSIFPSITCNSANLVEIADANCQFTLGDYTNTTNATDNCIANLAVIQTPPAGSSLSGAGFPNPIVFTAIDGSGNIDTCQITMTLLDTISPVYTNCPQDIVFTPTFLDCNPPVTWTAPTASDACGASSTASHTPGGNFMVGTTTVTYTATDSSGNTGNCEFDITVNNPILDNELTAVPGTTACEGQTITLIATPGYNAYGWTGALNGPSIVVDTSGIYWVDIIDSNNCIGRDSILINFLPVPNQPTISQVNDSVCATGATGALQWLNNGNPIPGATGNCVVSTGGGNFSLVVTDGNGCTATSDVIAVVSTVDPTNAGFFSLFPNPAANELNVRVTEAINKPGTIVIYDIAGRLVLEQEFRQLSGTITLNISDLPQGSFVVEITSGDRKARKSVVHIR